MAISFNVEPYWDDFESVATGNTLSPKEQYQRILFRPGKAVQARELTQLQTQLQNQISSAGDHIFKDGSVVVPGAVHLHNKIDYVRLSAVHANNDSVAELVGTEFSNSSSTVARVIHATLASGDDSITIFVQYIAGTIFAAGESLTASGGKTATVASSNDANGKTPIGFGSIVAIEDGIYYIKKHFITVKAKTIVLNKYSENVSFDIGLLITEALVSSGSDSSLNDNATGTPNESAPGAHRYSITAALTSQAVNANSGNFVLIARLESGIITKKAGVDYNALQDELARRTFDESGNYYVNPFPAVVKTHQADSPSATKLSLAVGPSKAYVRGYEITKLGTSNVHFNKARTSELVTDKLTEITHNNFIEVDNMVGTPDITTFNTISIENSGGTEIGTCRARSIERVSGDGASTASRYRVHIFDVKFASGNTTGMASATQLDETGGGSFAAQIAQTSSVNVFNLGPDSLVYQLPYDRIKTCNSQTDGSTDFNYRYETNRIIASATVSGTGTATFEAVAANEQFGSKSLNTNWILINDTDSTVGGEEVTTSDITINNGATPPNVVISNLPVSSQGDTVRLIAPVVRTLNQKTKSLVVNQSTPLNAGTDYTTISSDNALGHADVYRIVKIEETGTSPVVDVTEHFDLDNGQRDTHYDVGHIQLKSTSNYAAAVALTVTYDYFTHTAGDFFTVDSYTGLDYENIPKHGDIELRSAVDFRPRMDNGGSNFTGTGAVTAFAPTRFSQFETDIQFYLPRMDKVYLDSSGDFGVSEGIPARAPEGPAIPSDAMHLFTLSIPAYTLSTEEVGIGFVDQRRYTMRDIGKLDTRLNQVEYYTALNFLETEAQNTQILDTASPFNPRWKSGYLVDAFANTRMSRNDSPEYRASVDIANRTLRPGFAQGNAALSWISGSSDTVKTGDLITLPYSHSAAITQTQYSGSVNVNPYNVFNWVGAMALSPSTDEWLDIERRPEVVLNNDGEFDAMVEALQPQLGTVWGSWTTNWSGGGGHWEMSYTPGATRSRRGRTATVRGSWSRNWVSGNRQISGKSRSGVQTSIAVETSRVEQGDRVVEVNFVPFMRSRLVHFSATRMKPNTTVYAFFDGVSVANFVNEAQPGHTPLVGINTETAHPSGAGALTTDANGAVSGSFLIPNNSATQFSAGTKEFRLTSDSTNNEGLSRTSATADYTAAGLIETRENVIISTRIPRIQRTNVSSGNVAYSDPLAQSFLFDKAQFITKLDLYFVTKDANIPVQVQIREMVNGFPTQTVVPFSDVTLNPGSVNIDGSATTFTFPSPVFLQDGIEYAFVILANSNDYTVRFAEVGAEDQSGNRISQQPYNGVLFKSANASTWTAEQGKDLTFVMHRAEFDTSQTRNAVLRNGTLEARALGNNPITTTNSSQNITVAHRDHGHAVGDSVTIAGVAATINGHTTTHLNKAHTITAVTRDTYTFVSAGTGSATGIGGGAACTATQHLAWNTVKPIIQELILPDTGTTYTIKDTAEGNGTTIGTTALAIRANQDYTPLSPKVIKSGATHTVELESTFTSSNSYLSPVIDMERCSLITIGNRIDNVTSGEATAAGGANLAKYVTKTVELQNDSDGIKLIMDLHRPNNTFIDVYHKTGNNLADFDTESWVLATNDETTVAFSDGYEFNETVYTITPAATFTLFAIKIVMRSTNTSDIPMVQQLRAIALQV